MNSHEENNFVRIGGIKIPVKINHFLLHCFLRVWPDHAHKMYSRIYHTHEFFSSSPRWIEKMSFYFVTCSAKRLGSMCLSLKQVHFSSFIDLLWKKVVEAVVGSTICKPSSPILVAVVCAAWSLSYRWSGWPLSCFLSTNLGSCDVPRPNHDWLSAWDAMAKAIWTRNLVLVSLPSCPNKASSWDLC